MLGNPQKAEASGAMRKQGKPLSAAEKWMVVSVFAHCDQERRQGPGVKTVDPYQRTARYTGVGRRQVVEIVRHVRDTGDIPPVPHAGNHTLHVTTIPSCRDAGLREFILSKHREGIAINAHHRRVHPPDEVAGS